MRNIFIILIIVVSIGYMFNILINKYERIKETNNQNNKVTEKTIK